MEVQLSVILFAMNFSAAKTSLKNRIIAETVKSRLDPNTFELTFMREYQVKTVKVGESIVVALPHELLSAEHVTEGMTLKITIQKCRNESDAPSERTVCDEDDPWKALE
jgi:hypothetical protein